MKAKTVFIAAIVIIICAYVFLKIVSSQNNLDEITIGHIPEDLKYLLGNWVNENDNASVFIFNDGHSFIWYLNKTDYRTGSWKFLDASTVEISYVESGITHVEDVVLDKNNNTVYFNSTPMNTYKKLSVTTN